MIRNKRRAILLVGRLRQNMCLNPLVLQWAERELGWSASESKWFATSVTSARDVLGIIAGSVLSVGGVVFSVTMVALTRTPGRYVPKILRHFLGDNGSKISLGMFLGASPYCLAVMSRYNESDHPGIVAWCEERDCVALYAPGRCGIPCRPRSFRSRN
jgi:hypothetical protein